MARRRKRGGFNGLLAASRYRAYNYARWVGNVQPWLDLSASKIVRRYARRYIGRLVGRTFSWPRLLGL